MNDRTPSTRELLLTRFFQAFLAVTIVAELRDKIDTIWGHWKDTVVLLALINVVQFAGCWWWYRKTTPGLLRERLAGYEPDRRPSTPNLLVARLFQVFLAVTILKDAPGIVDYILHFDEWVIGVFAALIVIVQLLGCWWWYRTTRPRPKSAPQV